MGKIKNLVVEAIELGINVYEKQTLDQLVEKVKKARNDLINSKQSAYGLGINSLVRCDCCFQLKPRSIMQAWVFPQSVPMSWFDWCSGYICRDSRACVQQMDK